MWLILETLDSAPELMRERDIVQTTKGIPQEKQITNKDRVTVHQTLKNLIKHELITSHQETHPYYEITNKGTKNLMKRTQKT